MKYYSNIFLAIQYKKKKILHEIIYYYKLFIFVYEKILKLGWCLDKFFWDNILFWSIFKKIWRGILVQALGHKLISWKYKKMSFTFQTLYDSLEQGSVRLFFTSVYYKGK